LKKDVGRFKRNKKAVHIDKVSEVQLRAPSLDGWNVQHECPNRISGKVPIYFKGVGISLQGMRRVSLDKT